MAPGSDPERRSEAAPVEQGEVVDGVPVDARPRRPPAHRRVGVDWQESRYTSPLPSPDDLERYTRLLPDAPERLLAAGEREQQHRHDVENRLLTVDERAMPLFYAGQKRAHVYGLVLGILYMGVMVAAILMGATLEGIAGAAFGLAAVVWAVRRDPASAETSGYGEDEPRAPREEPAPDRSEE